MDDASRDARGAGLKLAVSRLVAGALGLARTRLELAGVELALERERVFSLLVLGVAGAVFASLAVAALSIGIVAYYWETHRYQSIAALVVIYGALAAFAFLRAATIVRRAPVPFSATLAEFDKDREAITGEPRPPAA